jgi:hypothetical protein
MKSQNMARTIALQSLESIGIMLLLGFLMLIIPSVSAWNSTTFSNGLSYENLTFTSASSLNGACYQETTNVSTSCGGLATGNYSYNDGRWTDWNNAFDGDVTTFATWNVSSGTSGNPFSLWFTYKKPLGAVGAIWQTTDNDGTVNTTIPSSCFTEFPDRIVLAVKNYPTAGIYKLWWTCGSGALTGFGTLVKVSQYQEVDNPVYEESIIWNISNKYERYLSIPKSVSLLRGNFNLSGLVASSSSMINGSIAYWSMNDISSTNVGEMKGLYNGSLNGTWSTGILGNAVNFTSSLTNNVTIPHNESLNFGTGDGTISLWFYPSKLTACSIIDKRPGLTGPEDGYRIMLDDSSHIKYGFDNTPQLIAVPTFTAGNWYNILMNRNGGNVSLYINGTIIHSFIDGSSDQTNTFPTRLSSGAAGWCDGKIDEVGMWNRSFSNTEVSSLYNSGVGINYTVITNTITNSAANITVKVNSSVVWNYNGAFNQSNNKTNSLANVINSYLGSCVYSGGYCQVPFSFYSDTSGNLQYSNLYFDNQGIIENNQTFNSTTYETSKENFALNITYDSSAYTPSATLIWNGTSYSSSVTLSTNNALFSTTIDMPLVLSQQNKSFYWNITLTDSLANKEYYTSNVKNQSVNVINFTLCSGTPMNVPFLNITFKNETLAAENVKSVLSGTFTYWFGDGTINKTYAFTNASENSAYTFCFSPADRKINVYALATYSNSYSPQRSYANLSLLSNSTTQKSLSLLPLSVGQYVSFQVQTISTAKIANALVTVRKTSDGSLVDQKYTDGAGIAAVWLNPLTSYAISVTASGYLDYSISLTPTETSYLVTMTSSTPGSGTPSFPNPIIGISYSFSPSADIIDNGTTYNFIFDISSLNSNLESYGFTLTNKSGYLLGVKSGVNSAGEELSSSVNTGSQDYILMNWYYLIGGNQTNGTRQWLVVNPEGSDWSIKRFFDDLITYTDNSTDGLFGVKRGTPSGNFTLSIVIFLIVLMFTGIMSYKYGITSETAIVGVLFSLVLFFDVGVALLPNPISPVPHFPTIFMAVILFVMFIREAYY